MWIRTLAATAPVLEILLLVVEQSRQGSRDTQPLFFPGYGVAGPLIPPFDEAPQYLDQIFVPSLAHRTP